MVVRYDKRFFEQLYAVFFSIDVIASKKTTTTTFPFFFLQIIKLTSLIVRKPMLERDLQIFSIVGGRRYLQSWKGIMAFGSAQGFHRSC